VLFFGLLGSDVEIQPEAVPSKEPSLSASFRSLLPGVSRVVTSASLNVMGPFRVFACRCMAAN
jgi:hypothetical protein